MYANHLNIIDFADAEATRPQLDINLLEGETGVVEYPMRSSAFASVHSLSLFFVRRSSSYQNKPHSLTNLMQNESVGEDISRIYYLGFRGDMRNTKTAVASQLEVPTPHAAHDSIVGRAANQASQQTTAR